MKHVLQATLCLSLFAAAAAPAPARAAAASADAGEDDDIPDGCWKTWFCYSPPSNAATHPELAGDKFKVYLASLVLGFPYVQWVVSDDGKAAYRDEDLLDQAKAQYLPLAFLVPAYLVSYVAMFTIILLPLGYCGMLLTTGVAAAWYLWFAPITRIQLVNRALMRDAPGKGRRKARRPSRAASDDDDG